MNNVSIAGNLGADPEGRSLGDGKFVCNLRVATSEYNGEKEWHRVTVFGKQAESAATYLRKGSKVGITGRIRTRQWEDRDGNKRYTTEIIANSVEFLSPRGVDTGPNTGGDNSGQGDDDDIPF